METNLMYTYLHARADPAKGLQVKKDEVLNIT